MYAVCRCWHHLAGHCLLNFRSAAIPLTLCRARGKRSFIAWVFPAGNAFQKKFKRYRKGATLSHFLAQFHAVSSIFRSALPQKPFLWNLRDLQSLFWRDYRPLIWIELIHLKAQDSRHSDLFQFEYLAIKVAMNICLFRKWASDRF